MQTEQSIERLATAILNEKWWCSNGPCGEGEESCCYYCPKFETCSYLHCSTTGSLFAKIGKEDEKCEIILKGAPNCKKRIKPETIVWRKNMNSKALAGGAIIAIVIGLIGLGCILDSLTWLSEIQITVEPAVTEKIPASKTHVIGSIITFAAITLFFSLFAGWLVYQLIGDC